MRQNQKYFPLFGADGKLSNRFLIVSNMRLADPANIVGGNERVVRPRLADARFFFDTDQKVRLAERVAQLGAVTYHNKLGSQLDRVQRLELLAEFIAARIGADVGLARRAAHLAKADLVTGMVGEFPELQGLMGGHYARHDGEAPEVARALQEQYRLRAAEAGDDALVSIALYLADRAELLTGLFGIGVVPSGDKDPFGLRRAALGLISVFESLGAAPARTGRPLALRELLEFAAGTFAAGALKPEALVELEPFIYERYRHQLAAQYPRGAVDAVIALEPPLDEVIARVAAVVEFQALPEAAALAAANKRIRNILKKSESADGALRAELLVEPAERALSMSIDGLQPAVEGSFRRREYTAALKALASARATVDTFFDQVMVNAEDAAVRANRLALLRRLEGLMNRVADISRLAA
jgi:glycyl-tRNA synthetase beta chain